MSMWMDAPARAPAPSESTGFMKKQGIGQRRTGATHMDATCNMNVR